MSCEAALRGQNKAWAWGFGSVTAFNRYFFIYQRVHACVFSVHFFGLLQKTRRTFKKVSHFVICIHVEDVIRFCASGTRDFFGTLFSIQIFEMAVSTMVALLTDFISTLKNN